MTAGALSRRTPRAQAFLLAHGTEARVQIVFAALAACCCCCCQRHACRQPWQTSPSLDGWRCRWACCSRSGWCGATGCGRSSHRLTPPGLRRHGTREDAEQPRGDAWRGCRPGNETALEEGRTAFVRNTGDERSSEGAAKGRGLRIWPPRGQLRSASREKQGMMDVLWMCAWVRGGTDGRQRHAAARSRHAISSDCMSNGCIYR